MIREKIIIDYIKGKDVLDIGSVGQTSAYNLWNIMERYAGSLTGIDTELSRNKNVVCGNMETYDFGKKFDVIVAGDVIEHLDNQGLFLANVKRHLRLGGFLIITTPNAKWLTVACRPNATHTCWHDKYTLTHLLNRHNFEVFFFRYYYGNKEYYNLPKRILTYKQAMLVVCREKKQL